MKNFKPSSFKIGDKVKIVKSSWKNNTEGKNAIVIKVEPSRIGVQFPTKIECGHACGGVGPNGYCYFFYEVYDIVKKIGPTQLELF